MSRDCLRQWCRINRILKRDNELKGEWRRTEGKKRKDKNGRIREKEIMKRGGECKEKEGRKRKPSNVL